MKKYLLHGIWLLIAALLVISGIGLFVDAGNVLVQIAKWIGVLLMITGVLQIIRTALMHKTPFGDRSFATRGAMLALVGFMIGLQPVFASSVLWVLISMMVVYNGLSNLGAAMHLYREKSNSGWGLLGMGVAEIVLGVGCFINPELIAIPVGVLIGLALAVEGVAVALVWYFALYKQPAPTAAEKEVPTDKPVPDVKPEETKE